MAIEYRIKPVTRYIVTRHEDTGNTGSTREVGNGFDNADVAYEVGYAVAREEARRLNLPIDSMDLIYPQHPREVGAILEDGGAGQFPLSGYPTRT